MEKQAQTTSQIDGADLEGIIQDLKNDDMKAVCLLGAARRGLLSQEGVIDIVETCSSKGNYSEAGEIALRAGNLELSFECYKKSDDGYEIEKIFSKFKNNPVYRDRMPELYSISIKRFCHHVPFLPSLTYFSFADDGHCCFGWRLDCWLPRHGSATRRRRFDGCRFPPRSAEDAGDR